MKALEDSLPCAPDNAREILGLVSLSIYKRKCDRIGEELDAMFFDHSPLRDIGYCRICGEYFDIKKNQLIENNFLDGGMRTRTIYPELCSTCNMLPIVMIHPYYSAKIYKPVSIGNRIKCAAVSYFREMDDG